MIDPNHPTLSVSRQCQLLAISRSSLYYRPVIDNSADLALMALIDRQFLETPYYGSRKMTAWLCRQGYAVNRKRVRRLMRQMGLQAIWQKPNTEPGASDLSISASWLDHRAAKPSLGGRYHLCADAQGLAVLGGHYGLAFSQGAGLALIEYTTC